MVTDGGASSTSGYYGWVLASPSEILYSGSGRLDCHSSQLQSLRPETTAMLACSTFLLHFLNTHHTRVRSSFAHWVDNMSLVRRIQRYSRGEQPTQKLMLLPDMDLQLQLEDTLGKLRDQHYVTPDTQHVKGHQDTLKGGTLLWQETLNVAADEVASGSECSPQPSHYFLPKQVVALHLNGIQITTAYKATLGAAWAERGSHSILKYLSNKYNWNAGTAHKICWEAVPRHKMGTSKRSFIVSYCHQWLPLHKAMHERSTVGTPLCPLCDMAEEDHRHFMGCPGYKGLTQQAILGHIDTCAKAQRVDPVLGIIVQRGLQAALSGRTRIKSSDIPSGYAALVAEQEEIGWSHLWHSRWSKRWGDYQKDYERTQETPRTDGVKWIRSITTTIWEQMHKKWIERGKVLKGHKGRAGRVGLQNRVARLHELKEQLPTRYQFLFRLDKQQTLSQKNEQILVWLRITEPIVNRAINRMRRRKTKETGLEKWMGGRRKVRKKRRDGRKQIRRWGVRIRARRRTSR